MKKFLTRIYAICLLGVILATAVLSTPARAAAASFTVDKITPDTIVNNITNTVRITGANFPNLAKVEIGTDEAVVTSFAADLLILRIPSAFEPGDYSITVTNPANPLDFVRLPNAFHVLSPTPTPPLPGRPIIKIDDYSISVKKVRYGEDFTLEMSLDNAGGSTARSMTVTFASTDLLMISNGGVIAAGDLGTAGKANFGQRISAAAPLTDKIWVSLDMTVAYTDDKGTAYTDKFNLAFPSIPTPPVVTPIPSVNTHPDRAQLVITEYSTDVDPLQPGYEFTLSLSVKNVGTLGARNITMISGGGSSSGSGSGTQVPGGTSGGSGDFSNFAPVDTSNLQSLGNLDPNAVVAAKQKLIVNVSANPGAYPMKISFTYTDANGNQVTDDQVITLLIYSLPNVDVGFYQPVSDFYVGQMGPLPLQVTSLGKRQAVLGKMKVESAGGMVTNGEALVGSLDPGGYFTLDAMVMPNEPGPLELNITIEYTDDFNQVKSITKTLTLNVIDAPIMPTPDPNNPEGNGGKPVSQGNAWQKVWRFVLGLFGLDSSVPSTNSPGGPIIPTEPPINVPPIKGGKG